MIDIFFRSIKKKLQYTIIELFNENSFVAMVLHDVAYDTNQHNFEYMVLLFSISKNIIQTKFYLN